MQERNRDITSVSSSGGPGAEGMCLPPFPYSLPYLEAIVNFYILAPTFSKPRDCNLLLLSYAAPQLPIFVYEFSLKSLFVEASCRFGTTISFC